MRISRYGKMPTLTILSSSSPNSSSQSCNNAWRLERVLEKCVLGQAPLTGQDRHWGRRKHATHKLGGTMKFRISLVLLTLALAASSAVTAHAGCTNPTIKGSYAFTIHGQILTPNGPLLGPASQR